MRLISATSNILITVINISLRNVTNNRLITVPKFQTNTCGKYQTNDCENTTLIVVTMINVTNIRLLMGQITLRASLS